MKRYLLLLLFIAVLQYRAFAQDIHFTIVDILIDHPWLSEGAALGLSLTYDYDMVVKGHGGSINVNSVESQGSEFIIVLPLV